MKYPTKTIGRLGDLHEVTVADLPITIKEFMYVHNFDFNEETEKVVLKANAERVDINQNIQELTYVIVPELKIEQKPEKEIKMAQTIPEIKEWIKESLQEADQKELKALNRMLNSHKQLRWFTREISREMTRRKPKAVTITVKNLIYQLNVLHGETFAHLFDQKTFKTHVILNKNGLILCPHTKIHYTKGSSFTIERMLPEF